MPDDVKKELFASDADASRIEIELNTGETRRNFEAMSKEELVAHSLYVRRWQLQLYWKTRRKISG